MMAESTSINNQPHLTKTFFFAIFAITNVLQKHYNSQRKTDVKKSGVKSPTKLKQTLRLSFITVTSYFIIFNKTG